MRQGVSIIVCCYNSASNLPLTIEHLAKQLVPKEINWEVIIVDNASTDDTAKIAYAEWGKFNLLNVDFKVITQPKPGLAFARELGISSANYNYIVFCDDDNWLFPEYVVRSFNIMEEDQKIGVLGGRGIVVAEEPVNFPDSIIKKITVHGSQTWAKTDHWVYGAGSVYRKSILTKLSKLGWKQITTGRNGSKLTSGEDVETCFMVYLLGYKIIADDSLVFKHFVSIKKQTNDFRVKMAFGLSYSYFLIQGYAKIISNDSVSLNKIIIRLFYFHLKALAKKKTLLLFKQLVHGDKPTIEDRIIFQNHYGMIVSILENRTRLIKHYQHIMNIIKNLHSL